MADGAARGPLTCRKGDAVVITYDGRTVDGEVLLASANGQSLVLGFEALLGGHVGVMPVLWRSDVGGYADLMTGQPVGVDAASMAGEAADPDSGLTAT